MYNQRTGLSGKITDGSCPTCKSNIIRMQGNKIYCQNCGTLLVTKASNKFGAKRTVAMDGLKRDSKYEASVADDLFARKKINDILDYDSQFKVEVWCYRENGLKAFKITHKVDFRIHHKDGSYELLEAKGVETQDYKMRRRFLEEIWLPDHPDHIYTVVKQNKRPRRR